MLQTGRPSHHRLQYNMNRKELGRNSQFMHKKTDPPSQLADRFEEESRYSRHIGLVEQRMYCVGMPSLPASLIRLPSASGV